MTRRAFKNLQTAREKQRQEANGAQSIPQFQDSVDAPVAAVEATPDSSALYVNMESADLMSMSPVDRQILAQSIKVKVFIGSKLVQDILVSRNLLIAASSKGNTLINNMNDVHLPQNCDEKYVRMLLDWVNTSGSKNKMMALPMAKKIYEIVELYIVAEALGMMKYIQPSLTFHHKAILNRIPHCTELSLIENRATTEDNLLVQFFAERIAFLIRKNQLPDQEYLAMVARNEKINAAVHQNNAQWEQRQAEKAAAAAQRADDKRKYEERKARRAEEDCKQKERAEKRYQNNPIRAELLEKIRQSRDGKVVVLTRVERAQALYYRNVAQDPEFVHGF